MMRSSVACIASSNKELLCKFESSECFSTLLRIMSRLRLFQDEFLKNWLNYARGLFLKFDGLLSGTPQIVDVKISASDVPEPSKKGDKQYVYLIAKSTSPGLKFEKVARILLSRRSRAVYMQTDKPIYTPTQTGKVI